jgi:hypothetical protein
MSPASNCAYLTGSVIFTIGFRSAWLVLEEEFPAASVAVILMAVVPWFYKSPLGKRKRYKSP